MESPKKAAAVTDDAEDNDHAAVEDEVSVKEGEEDDEVMEEEEDDDGDDEPQEDYAAARRRNILENQLVMNSILGLNDQEDVAKELILPEVVAEVLPKPVINGPDCSFKVKAFQAAMLLSHPKINDSLLDMDFEDENNLTRASRKIACVAAMAFPFENINDVKTIDPGSEVTVLWQWQGFKPTKQSQLLKKVQKLLQSEGQEYFDRFKDHGLDTQDDFHKIHLPSAIKLAGICARYREHKRLLDEASKKELEELKKQDNTFTFQPNAIGGTEVLYKLYEALRIYDELCYVGVSAKEQENFDDLVEQLQRSNLEAGNPVEEYVILNWPDASQGFTRVPFNQIFFNTKSTKSGMSVQRTEFTDMVYTTPYTRKEYLDRVARFRVKFPRLGPSKIKVGELLQMYDFFTSVDTNPNDLPKNAKVIQQLVIDGLNQINWTEHVVRRVNLLEVGWGNERFDPFSELKAKVCKTELSNQQFMLVKARFMEYKAKVESTDPVETWATKPVHVENKNINLSGTHVKYVTDAKGYLFTAIPLYKALRLYNALTVSKNRYRKQLGDALMHDQIDTLQMDDDIYIPWIGSTSCPFEKILAKEELGKTEFWGNFNNPANAEEVDSFMMHHFNLVRKEVKKMKNSAPEFGYEQLPEYEWLKHTTYRALTTWGCNYCSRGIIVNRNQKGGYDAMNVRNHMRTKHADILAGKKLTKQKEQQLLAMKKKNEDTIAKRALKGALASATKTLQPYEKANAVAAAAEAEAAAAAAATALAAATPRRRGGKIILPSSATTTTAAALKTAPGASTAALSSKASSSTKKTPGRKPKNLASSSLSSSAITTGKKKATKRARSEPPAAASAIDGYEGGLPPPPTLEAPLFAKFPSLTTPGQKKLKITAESSLADPISVMFDVQSNVKV